MHLIEAGYMTAPRSKLPYLIWSSSSGGISVREALAVDMVRRPAVGVRRGNRGGMRGTLS